MIEQLRSAETIDNVSYALEVSVMMSHVCL